MADLTSVPTRGKFRRYEHLERLGHSETQEIDHGVVHVFPKLDGTNVSAWVDANGAVRAGSRNRTLTVEHDNHGFCAWVQGDDPKAAALRAMLLEHPNLVVYGEWLVPHTLKSYRDDAWRRFWIFDVFDHDSGRYLSHDDYAPMLAGCDVVLPLCTIDNPSTAQLIAQCETNTYLVATGAGVGEGVVIKRYDWTNGNGGQTWAKLVRNEFKENNATLFGVANKSGAFQVEAAIAEKFCTPTLVGKTRAKVIADVANRYNIDLVSPNAQQLVEHQYRRIVIPQLLGRTWCDFITEESWSFVKDYGNPTIDFRRLHGFVVRRVKQCAADLFGSMPEDVSNG